MKNAFMSSKGETHVKVATSMIHVEGSTFFKIPIELFVSRLFNMFCSKKGNKSNILFQKFLI